jgi:ABC-type phosphate transport system substrate-binding protein
VTRAYQIGTDEVMIVVHPQAGVGAVTASEVGALFTGQVRNWREVGGSDLPVEIWAYEPTVDIQMELDRAILHGRPVSSLARLAVTAQHMSDSVGAVPGSIGLLPRRWKAGNTQEALVFATLPVLAITQREPDGALARLIECMQAAQ